MCNVCEKLPFPQDNSFNKYGNDIYKQVTGMLTGANYVQLLADMFLFCYESGLIKILFKSNVLNLILNSTLHLDTQMI